MSIKSLHTRKTLKAIEKITGSQLTLGALIFAIRESEEMNQVDFAEKKLGISKQQLCDIERGRKTISLKLAADYARKLEYPESQFVRLCLQEMINKAKLNLTVEIIPHYSKNSRSSLTLRFAH